MLLFTQTFVEGVECYYATSVSEFTLDAIDRKLIQRIRLEIFEYLHVTDTCLSTSRTSRNPNEKWFLLGIDISCRKTIGFYCYVVLLHFCVF